LKRKADGSLGRHKARLVAKGFHQQPGIDYGETYSSVIKLTTVRLILSLAISNGWPIHQINIQNAFLHGNLSEEVYMAQPLGFAHPQYPSHTCKLKKGSVRFEMGTQGLVFQIKQYLDPIWFYDLSV